MRFTTLLPRATWESPSTSPSLQPISTIWELRASLRWYEALIFACTRRLLRRCLVAAEISELKVRLNPEAPTQSPSSQLIVCVVSTAEPTEFESPAESSSTTRVH